MVCSPITSWQIDGETMETVQDFIFLGSKITADGDCSHEIKRLLRVPWTARRSNESILKEISPEYSLEGLMLKLKLQSFGHLMWRADSFWTDPDAGKDWGQEENGMTEDEMVGWHQWLDGHEFEQALGVSDGQRSLACYSPWGHKESDTTEQLNTPCCAAFCTGFRVPEKILISVSKF